MCPIPELLSFGAAGAVQVVTMMVVSVEVNVRLLVGFGSRQVLS